MLGPQFKRFFAEGAVKTLDHLQNKQAFEEDRLKQRMASCGYVPVLDITPLVGHAYDADKETFRYVITMYGVEVEETWKYEGWLSGELIKATNGTQFKRLSKAWALK